MLMVVIMLDMHCFVNIPMKYFYTTHTYEIFFISSVQYRLGRNVFPFYRKRSAPYYILQLGVIHQAGVFNIETCLENKVCLQAVR